jgi:hypothetical protein
VPELRKEGFLTKIQEEEERIALREKEIEVENADKDLELSRDVHAADEPRERQNGVKDADRGLINAREKSEISLKEKAAKHERRGQGEVDRSAPREAREGARLHDDPRAAPRGRLLRPIRRSRGSTTTIKLGNRIHQGNTVITLPDLKEMQVLIQVHEADIDLVQARAAVRVTLEAIKERVFDAKVTRIGAVATRTGATREQDVRGRGHDGSDRRRAARGTTAKAEIQVETVPDTLHVPSTRSSRRRASTSASSRDAELREARA